MVTARPRFPSLNCSIAACTSSRNRLAASSGASARETIWRIALSCSPTRGAWAPGAAGMLPQPGSERARARTTCSGLVSMPNWRSGASCSSSSFAVDDWTAAVVMNCDATSLRWGNTDVAQDPYEIWHSSQIKDGSNFVSFRNAQVDALIEQARATLDDARRNEMYRQLGRILYDEAPYVFLYNRPSLDAVRDRVHGIRPSVVWYDLQDVWLARR